MNQINHRLVKFLRLFTLSSVGTYDKNYVDDELKKEEFSDPSAELSVWRNYHLAIMNDRNSQSSLRQDREDLREHMKKTFKNVVQIKAIKNGLEQKKIVFKHSEYAMQRWNKVMLNRLILGSTKRLIGL